jgi:hypothetical protein
MRRELAPEGSSCRMGLERRSSHDGRRLHRTRVLRGTREGGQATVLLVLLLMSLLGVAAFTIDYGFWS